MLEYYELKFIKLNHSLSHMIGKDYLATANNVFMKSTVLSTHNLSFLYNNGPNLSFQDCTIFSQEHTLILGDSGCGKSTLLNLWGGLSKPTTGYVQILGQNMYQLSTSKLDIFRSQNIGYIFQDAHLLNNLTVFENIKLAVSLARKKVNKDEIIYLLNQLHLSEETYKYPRHLSRGQLQRAAIARAIINRPKILFADEPTAALDDSNTKRVYSLLRDIADNYGSTLIVATHDKRLKDNFTNTLLLDNPKTI